MPRSESPTLRFRLGILLSAAELKRLAATSVAAPELEAQVGFEMRLLIGQYDLLEQQIRDADQRLAGRLDGDVAQRLLSIPGVGASTAASLMAEIGDIWRFTDVDQLLGCAAVHPKEQHSGKKGADAETSWVMAKTGNAFLREAAHRMAVVIQHKPVSSPRHGRHRRGGVTWGWGASYC
jgi:transposase